MTTRISWDEYGLKLAEAAALRADCTRRRVGAVILAEDGSVVATGYNGLAAGRPGCLSEGACPRGQMDYGDNVVEVMDGRGDVALTYRTAVPANIGYEATGCRAVHAEINAIIRAGRDRCIGATIYVTDEPCFHCSVVIEGAGLARVVVRKEASEDSA